ncbi:hypothetical protein LCGC14_1134670, partial [marine sediment metagenome]
MYQSRPSLMHLMRFRKHKRRSARSECGRSLAASTMVRLPSIDMEAFGLMMFTSIILSVATLTQVRIGSQGSLAFTTGSNAIMREFNPVVVFGCVAGDFGLEYHVVNTFDNFRPFHHLPVIHGMLRKKLWPLLTGNPLSFGIIQCHSQIILQPVPVQP